MRGVYSFHGTCLAALLLALAVVGGLAGSAAAAIEDRYLDGFRVIRSIQSPTENGTSRTHAGVACTGQQVYLMSIEQPQGWVYRLNAAGQRQERFGSDLGSAYSLAWDGTQFWALNHNTMTVFALDEQFRRKPRLINISRHGWRFAGDLTWDGERFWLGVQEQVNSGYKVVAFDLNGSIQHSFPSPQESLPSAIAYAPATNSLWVSGLGWRRAYHYTLHGELIQRFGGEPFDSPSVSVTGMAVNPITGNLWVAGRGAPDMLYEVDITPPRFQVQGSVVPLHIEQTVPDGVTWRASITHPSQPELQPDQVWVSINGRSHEMMWDGRPPNGWFLSAFVSSSPTLAELDLRSMNSYRILLRHGIEYEVWPPMGEAGGPYLGVVSYQGFEDFTEGDFATEQLDGCQPTWEAGEPSFSLQQMTPAQHKPLPGWGCLVTTNSGNYPDNAGERAILPLELPEGNLSVVFSMLRATERNFDGLALQMAIGRGPFRVADVNTSLSPEYDTFPMAEGSCALAGAEGYSGDGGSAWQWHRLDLRGFGEGLHRLGFVFSSDDSTGGPGVHIDDLMLLREYRSSEATPTPTPWPTPAWESITPLPTATPALGIGIAASFPEDRELRVNLRVFNETPFSYPVTAFVAVEVGGGFYFFPAFTEAALPLAALDLEPIETGFFRLWSAALPDPLPAPVTVTWYAALLHTERGTLLGELASSPVVLD